MNRRTKSYFLELDPFKLAVVLQRVVGQDIERICGKDTFRDSIVSVYSKLRADFEADIDKERFSAFKLSFKSVIDALTRVQSSSELSMITKHLLLYVTYLSLNPSDEEIDRILQHLSDVWKGAARSDYDFFVIADCVAEISDGSPAIAAKVASNEQLRDLILEVVNVFFSDDLLLRLNAFESIIKFSRVSQLSPILAGTDTLKFIINEISPEGRGDSNFQDGDRIILLDCASFMVQFASLGDKELILKAYLFHLTALDSNENVMRAILAALINVAMNSTDALEIFRFGDGKIIEAVLPLVYATSVSLKLAALHFISRLLSHSGKELFGYQEGLFSKLSYSDLLNNLVRGTSGAEIRFGIYSLYENTAIHITGVKKLIEMDGFMQYMLDRSTENEIRGLQWKYSILQNIRYTFDSKFQFDGTSIVDKDHLDKIDTYLASGVVYIVPENVPMVADDVV